MIVLSFAGPAQAMQDLSRYAGIVLDAKTGHVLYESAADSKRYPASVTKVMTLYVLFEELRAGRLKLTTRMKVSRHAAAAEPTKLGLRAGSTISVENAIKSLVTISANDMARTIAETISGSESKFARRMTATAHALGMRHTHYANASGLPNPDNFTTVRDQATLALAIYQHFPRYYKLLETRNFKYGKRTYRSHVPLLGVPGVEGLKTGWTVSSGYTLVNVTRRSQHHLIIVGFGFDTIGERNSKVAALITRYLPKSRRGSYLQTAMIPRPGGGGEVRVASAGAGRAGPVAPMPLPDFRLAALTAGPDDDPATQQEVFPLAPPEIRLANAALPAPPVIVGVSDEGAGFAPRAVHRDQSADPRRGAPPSALGTTRASAPLLPPANIGARTAAIDPLTSGAIAGATTGATASWLVQIGAAPSSDKAQGLLTAAVREVATLGDYRTSIERVEQDGRTFYRARFVGFGDRDGARQMCDRLERQDFACLALHS